MASGLIYLIIVGMWAAYFLPHWISSHEDSSGRSGEKYKNAIRTIGSSSTQLVPEFEEPLKRRRAIARRRAVFTSLIIVLATTSFLSLIGFLAPLMIAIPSTALIIYAANVRRQIVAQEIRQRRLQALQRVTETPVKVSEYSVQLEIQTQSSTQEHWIPLGERSDTSGVVVIPKDRSGWQPVSVPRPTYTTAAKAITPKRIIDLTVPGQWSAEQELVNDLARSGEQLFDQELAENAAIPQKDEWAVNE